MGGDDFGLLEAQLLSSRGFVHGFSSRKSDLARGLGERRIDEERLFQANQVHGAAVVVAEGEPSRVRATDADALVAREAGTAVAVRVADCVPVLVGADFAGAAAAIHAGWRGLVRGVIEAAVRELDRPRGSARGLVAAIGPCIGPCCFEVGLEVAQEIARVSSGDVIVRSTEAKAYVDLRRAVRVQLRRAGLADAEIEDVPGCTKHEPERFFSFRRDGPSAGRQLGIIQARTRRAEE